MRKKRKRIQKKKAQAIYIYIQEKIVHSFVFIDSREIMKLAIA